MADIGSTLREARMRERIDITTVESATKIRAKYLRALENEEWDQLPGPTFVRTFLRTYADYLGLDSKMLVEDYKQRFERPAPQDLLPFSAHAGGGRRPPRPPRVIPPFVVVGLAVLVLLGALFALGTLLGDDAPEDEVAATPTPAATARGGGDGDGRGKRRERERRRPAAARQVTLQIVPEGEVYVCLEDAAGERLVPGEIITEPTDTFRAKRMRVTFGNGLVRMRLGGETFDVPDTDAAVGYDLLPGAEPRELSSDALPTCT
jgi:cytoskeleton protein RodZ